MKVIPEILPGDYYEHKGDLTVEGDIGAGAKVLVKEGSLTIHGNINSDVQLTMSVNIYDRIVTNDLIRVENKQVIVDNQVIEQDISTSSAGQRQGPAKLKINGEIFDNVTINSDAKIEANKIGKNCTVTSNNNGISAQDIQEGTKINVRDSIILKNVGQNCILQSSNHGVSQ